MKGIIIIIVNINKGKLDIIKSESIIELIRFKKKSEKKKKSKMQINNKEYYHWSLRLTVLILIDTGNA